MKTMYKHYQITSTYKGDKNWDYKCLDNYNNHMIYITNKETKQKCVFEYWNSIMEGEIKTEQSLIIALYCFINDVIDSECYNDKKTYKQHIKLLEKYNRVFTEDVYDILNDLIDNYDC